MRNQDLLFATLTATKTFRVTLKNVSSLKAAGTLLNNNYFITVVFSQDAVLADLITRLHPKWIVGYLEHDSLLQNIESEELTPEEMKAAWEAYEAEKSGQTGMLAEVPETAQRCYKNSLSDLF